MERRNRHWFKREKNGEISQEVEESRGKIVKVEPGFSKHNAQY